MLSRSVETDNLKFVGPTATEVDILVQEVSMLLVEKEEVSEQVHNVERCHREMLMNGKGRELKAIQKSSGGAYLSFEKNVRKEGERFDNSSPSTITFKGTRTQIEAAKTLLAEKITEFEDGVVVIYIVDVSILPAIIGNKGENIKKVRKATGVTIDISDRSSATPSIRIYVTEGTEGDGYGGEGEGKKKGEGEKPEEKEEGEKLEEEREGEKPKPTPPTPKLNPAERVTAAKNMIEEIISQNLTEIVPIGQARIAAFLGLGGKPVRGKIQDEIKCRFDILREENDCKLRGSREQIDLAKAEIEGERGHGANII